MSGSLNDKVTMETYRQVSRFIKPGDSVQVIQFSSFNKDGFTNVEFKGRTDFPLSEDSRDHIRKSQLLNFDKCLKDQHQFFLARIGVALKESFSPQENTDFSEVITALVDISKQIVSIADADEKVVLLVSDMLENSASTTFYHRCSVRNINAKKELDNVIARDELGNFDNARVYIMGAGLLPGGQNYLSSKKMKLVEQFWSGYFSQSSADLKGFGKPLLLAQFK